MTNNEPHPNPPPMKPITPPKPPPPPDPAEQARSLLAAARELVEGPK